MAYKARPTSIPIIRHQITPKTSVHVRQAPNYSINVKLAQKINIVSTSRSKLPPKLTIPRPKPINPIKPIPIKPIPAVKKAPVIVLDRKGRATIRQPLLNTINSDPKISTLKDIGIGRILIIIAAGPSVNEVDLTPLKDNPLIDIMCINKPYKSVWPTKFWAFCDHTQYTRNEDTWNTYNGIIINSPNVSARKTNQIIIRTRHGKGFSRDIIGGYHIGRSSTYANMQVALFMNYNKIFIFGLDMTEVNGQLHHYGVNPDVNPENRKTRFQAEAENYIWAGQNLPLEIRKRYYVCSSYNPWEFCQMFNKMDHKTAVKDILLIADTMKK
jgi:hypothetical protein